MASYSDKAAEIGRVDGSFPLVCLALGKKKKTVGLIGTLDRQGLN